MAHNITTEHLHHMARRHHQTMKKLDGYREGLRQRAGFLFGTLETGLGAWLGGAVEGKTSGGTVLKVPINLGVGLVLIGVGHWGIAGERYNEHLNHLGNGFIGSYIAATGYAFGKRWRDTGKFLGGGGHPFMSPYENGWPHAAPAASASGDLSEAQMAAIVQRMQAAAGAPH